MIIQDLGQQAYISTWELQKRLVEKRFQSLISDHLLLVEHEPIYTQGRKKNPLLNLETELRYPIIQVERGGELSFHEPGQLVVYPIFALEENKRDIRAFLNGLEQTVIDTLAFFGFHAERDSRNTGVWIDGFKVASIGIAVRRWVTWHGVSININNSLALAQTIYPCGFEPNVMTSLAILKGNSICITDFKQVLTQNIRHWWIGHV